MTDLPDAVRTLLDKSDIAELLTRYMRAIDRGDVDALRACYAPDAIEQHGGLYSGPAQGYLDTIADAIGNPRLVATHTISNVLIEVDGDTARSEHYVLAMSRAKVEGTVGDSLVATRIVDDLARVDGRWLITRRRLLFDWAHDLGPRPDVWLFGRRDPASLLHSKKYPHDIIYENDVSEASR